MKPTRSDVISTVAILLGYAWLQGLVLPPDGFFAGDQGTKLLQTIATSSHGPFRPYIDVLSRDIDPGFRNQEPFLVKAADGRHVVGIFPWLFAALTAPFYLVAGLRGLYVIPALSVALTFVSARRVARSFVPTPARDWAGWTTWAGCAAALATPVLFYGAELWEHAPAAALSTAAVALVLDTRKTESRRLAAAGLCLGLAMGLRPEAGLMLPAVVLALLRNEGSTTRSGRAVKWLVLAWAVATALVVLPSRAIYGSFIPPHVTSNLAVGARDYLSQRRGIVTGLLLPMSNRVLFLGGLLAWIALATRGLKASAVRVWLCHALVTLFLIVGLALPLVQHLTLGLPLFVLFNVASLAHTWPFAWTLVYVIVVPSWHQAARQYRTVATILLAYLAGALLAMPHTGGAQWGPRFLLPAAPLAAVLACAPLHPTALQKLAPGLRTSIRLVSAVILAASVAVQAYGVRWLAFVKTTNHGIVERIEQLTAPGDVIVSDVFWVPQLASRLCSSRRLLFLWSPDEVHRVAAAAARLGHRRLAVVTSAPPTGRIPPRVLGPPALRPLFAHSSSRDIGARDLQLYWYERVEPRP